MAFGMLLWEPRQRGHAFRPSLPPSADSAKPPQCFPVVWETYHSIVSEENWSAMGTGIAKPQPYP